MHEPNQRDEQKNLLLAERELGAFVAAVDRTRGAEASQRAAVYWVEALEQWDAIPHASFDWRKITIAAASRLAQETISGSHRCTPIASVG